MSAENLPSIFEFRCYKQAIQQQVKQQKKTQTHMTLRYLASKIPVQYTYLSKVLNATEVHLSEDHLYSLASLLQLLPNEVEFLLLLRSCAVTENSARKNELSRKIESVSFGKKLRAEYLDGDKTKVHQDIEFLFNPLSVLVLGALSIKTYAKDARLLCPHLGITAGHLSEILNMLESSGYIRLEKNEAFKVKEVSKKTFHFTRNHPLLKAHLAIMKEQLAARLGQTRESNKESLIFTFSADENLLPVLKKEFDQFVKKIQEYTGDCKQTNIYQLNFDFLRWF